MNTDTQRVRELLDTKPHNAECIWCWRELQPIKETVLAHPGMCAAIDKHGYIGLQMAALYFLHQVSLSEMRTYIRATY